MPTPFPQIIAQSIERHAIMPPAALKDGSKTRVLVALSGGADSVALFRVMLELGYQCEAAHCNFHLRGAESDRDEGFCANLCRSLGVMLHRVDFHTADYAREHGISIEMAAREQRYAFFHRLKEEGGFDCVAVAHHRDDNVETILLNTVRGTGLRGLTGMPRRNGDVVRPLLDVSRRQILDYLNELGQDFVTDSSNLVADVKRNVVRLKLLPLLRELNPSIEDTLLSNADHAREVQQFVEQHTYINKVRLADGSMSISLTDVKEHLALYELLHPMGFTPAQISDIWQRRNGQSGAVWHSATHDLLRNRDCLVVREKGACDSEETAQIESRIVDIGEIKEISRDPRVAMLDADKVGNRMEVRHVREGDWFVPYGMKGRKLVSRYMVDCKMSAFQKERQLVVTNGKDIVWLVGQRPDDRFKIVEGQTTRVLCLRCHLPCFQRKGKMEI